MDVEIPKELKSDVPPSTWGKILTSTPVVMAVISTMLAGLSASEMTRAQYDRSYAAQMQSKAADQWAFFQAKRLRGAMQQSTVDVLQSFSEVRPLNLDALKKALSDSPSAADLDSAEGQRALDLLQRIALPPYPLGPLLDPKIKAASDAVENSKSEPEIKSLLARVNATALDNELKFAIDRARDLDTAMKPVSLSLDRFGAALTGPSVSSQDKRNFTAARLRFSQLRYEAEARLNQAIANLYELKVRINNISAEHHHDRSERFFYGMLAAQLAVIVATFAIAARQRNLLWSLAAAAGLVAIVIAVYVYVWV